MNELRFEDAAWFGLPDSAWVSEIPQPLTPVAEAFSENVKQLHALLAVPVCVAIWERHRTECELTAKLEICGVHDPDRNDPRWNQIEARYGELLNERSERLPLWGIEIDKLYARNDSTMMLLLECESPLFRDGIRAMIAAQILASWTFYETAVSDAWRICRKARPHLEASVKKSDHKKDKSISIPGICKFKKEFLGICGELKALKNRDLWLLKALRDAITHRAGTADRTFLDEVGDDALFDQCKEDQRIPITGTMTVRLTRAAVEGGVAILESLGNWLRSPLPEA